jgi:hypothetical protein
MPQLDLLILFNTCIENTLFFWIIYIFSVKFILSKINLILNIRRELKNNFFYKDMVVLSILYINNINYIKNIIYSYLLNKQKNISNKLSNISLIVYKENSYKLFNNLLFNEYLFNLKKYNYTFSYLISYNK